MWYSILTDAYKTSMTACSVWSWVLLSYRLQFSVRRIGCHGIQFRWRHSLFHDFFVLIPLLLVINSCSTKKYKFTSWIQDSSNVTYYYFQRQLRGNQGRQLESNWKTKGGGAGKKETSPSPSPPPPLFWHVNPTSISPLESFLTLWSFALQNMSNTPALKVRAPLTNRKMSV